MTILIKLIILVFLNSTVQIITKNLNIGHWYLEKLIMLGLGTPYLIHHNFSLKRVLELVILLLKVKS